MSAKKATGVIYLSLLILAAGVLTTGWHINAGRVFGKELRSETAPGQALVEVTLKLEGKTLPGKPKVISANSTFAALYEKAGTPLALQKLTENTWKCRAVKGEKYVIGWIAEKGWSEKRSKMFGYRSEPFVATDNLTVTFSPGMPATFEYDLTNPPDNVRVFPAKVSLLVETTHGGLNWGGHQEVAKPGVTRIEGLAGGKYVIFAQSVDSPISSETRTPLLYDKRQVELRPGIVNHFEPVYPEVDSTIEDGDVTIRGTLYGRNKKPLANKTVQLIPDSEKGAMPDLYYPPVVTDSSGRFAFTGVRPDLLGVRIESGRTSVLLGRKSLKENNSISVELVSPPGNMATEVGSRAGEISIEWSDGTTGRLSDFAGKTVVLDVWATWCAPCLEALPDINTLATTLSAKNDIVFVALSLDADHAIWKETVDKNNWNALRHGWFDPKKNAAAIKEPIPFYIVVDRDGTIRARGNNVDIRSELDKIAKGL